MRAEAASTADVADDRPAKPAPRRRRYLKFTREGRVFVLVTFGLGFAALNTGNNLMYLSMAFMLSLIIVSGILSELAIKSLHVKRRLPERAFAGEPMLIELAVYNEKPRLPSYSIELEDRAEGETSARRCYLLKIEPKKTRSVTYRRTVQQRGELRLERFRVGTRYPFSLFDKWRVQDDAASCLVYPRRERWDVDALASYREGEQDGRAAGRGPETRELRDYRKDDEVRRIHWLRSAALGRPIVRELQDEANRLVSLVIDNARPADDAGFDAQFESAIARAAYAVERLSGRGVSVEIVTRGERSALLGPGARVDPLWRFLACLSGIELASAPPLAPSRPGAQRVLVVGERSAA